MKARYYVDLGTLHRIAKRLGPMLVRELAATHSLTLVSLDKQRDAVTIEVLQREVESLRHELANHPWVISYQLQTSTINPPRIAA